MGDTTLTTELLQLQDSLNTRINREWRTAGNAWYRAIWTECAELIDHVGWKWWKHQALDLDQAQLEVVDIFHFALSDLLQRATSIEVATSEFMASLPAPKPLAGEADRQLIITAIESLALQTLSLRRIDLQAFWRLANAVQLDLAQLSRQYIGKNVLNRFRQDHGYKEGSYRKRWAGREDNLWLSELSAPLDPADTSFSQTLYGLLLATYKSSDGASSTA